MRVDTYIYDFVDTYDIPPCVLRPNFITSLGLAVLGPVSLVVCAAPTWHVPCVFALHLWRAVLDILDGASARRHRAATTFGACFDTWSDIVYHMCFATFYLGTGLATYMLVLSVGAVYVIVTQSAWAIERGGKRVYDNSLVLYVLEFIFMCVYGHPAHCASSPLAWLLTAYFSVGTLALLVVSVLFSFTAKHMIFRALAWIPGLSDHNASGWFFTNVDNHRLVLDEVVQHVTASSTTRPGSIMDIGCGSGAALSVLSQRFPASICYGSDVNAHLLRRAQLRCPGAHLDCVDMRTRHRFSSGCVDHCFSIGAMGMYLSGPDLRLALREAWRLLRPGGTLALTHCSDCPATRNSAVINRREVMSEALNDVGFEHIHMHDHQAPGCGRYFVTARKAFQEAEGR